MRKKKKIISMAITVAMASGLIPFYVHADASLAITGIKTSDTTVSVSFDSNVAETGISVIDDAGEIVEVTPIIIGDTVTVDLGEEAIGKSYYLGIDDGTISTDGATLGKDYITEIAIEGYYEDFNDGNEDWMYKSWNSNGKLIGEYNGAIKPISGAATYTDSEGKEVTYSGDSTLTYKSDYEKYNFQNQTLEFDYIKEIEDATGEGLAINFAAFVRAGNFEFKSSTELTVADGAYVIHVANDGDYLKIRKIPKNSSLSTIKLDSGWHLGDNKYTQPLASIQLGLEKNVKYNFKIQTYDVEIEDAETGTVTPGVAFDVVVTDGIEKKICRTIDKSDLLTGGKSYLATGKSRNDWGQYNAHVFDNISFTENKSITPTVSSVYEQILVDKINEIYDDESGNDLSVELAEVSKKVDFVKSVTGTFNAEADAKLQELISFTILNVETERNILKIKFSQMIDQDNLDENSIVVLDENGEDVKTSCTVDENDKNLVNIILPVSCIGKELKLVIKRNVKSAMNTYLSDVYIANFSMSGYSEAFDDYEANSWKLLAYEYQKGGDATNDDRKNENIIGTLGKLKPMAAAKTISDKEDGKSYIYSQSSTTFYKSNYTDYDFTDQSLFFDYQRQIDTQGDAGSKSFINAKAFIRSGEVSYSAANYVIEDGGYYFGIEQMGEKLVIGKFKGSWHIDNMHKASNDATVLKTVNISSNPIVKATEYSFRVDAVDVEDGVKITAYLKNSSGVYEEIISVVDTEDVFESGTALFMTGKTNWSAYNTNIFDNICFVGNEKIELESVSEKIDNIEERLDVIEFESDWTVYADELLNLKNELLNISEITGEDVSEGVAQADKLLAGRSEDELVEIITAPVAEKLKEKYENGEQIVVAGLGGSITQGGYARGIAMTEYAAELAGADNVEVLTYHSTDLELGTAVIDETADFIYINAGNGGQPGDWDMIRMYDDVMKYNPDIVILESCNDANLAQLRDGDIPSYTYLETRIRRLMNMEDTPLVVSLTEVMNPEIRELLLDKAGVLATASESNGSIKLTQRNKTVTEQHHVVAEYYDLAEIQYAEFMARYSEIKNLEDKIAYYVKDETGAYVECEEGTEGATLAVKPGLLNLCVPIIDYEGICEYIGTELDSYTSYDLNSINKNAENRNVNVSELTDEEKMNTFLRFSNDLVHPNNGGNKLHADILSALVRKETNAALRINTLPEKPFKVPVYDDVELKRVNITTDTIENSGRFTIEGAGSYEDATFTSNHGVKRNGVKFTGPLTIKIKFRGNSVDIEGAAADVGDIDGSTNANVFDSGISADNTTIDGLAWYSKRAYVNSDMLNNDTDHEIVITLDEGKTLRLANLYVDEDLDAYDFSEVNNKYVTINISKDANGYGAAKSTDGKVFSEQFSRFKDGKTGEETNYNNASIAEQIKYAPDIMINYVEDNYYYNSIDAEGFLEYMNSSYVGAIPYDVSILNNTRYRALVPSKLLISKKHQKYGMTEEQLAGYNVITVDTADDLYNKLYLLAAAKSDLETSVVLNYTDGTISDPISYNAYQTYNANPDLSSDASLTKIYEGKLRTNFDTSKMSSSTGAVYQYEIILPDTDKRVDSITFKSSNGLFIFGMTLEKKYSDGIFELEFKDLNGNLVNDIKDNKGEVVNVSAYVNKDSDEEAVVYVAIYNEGRLMEIKKLNANEDGGYVNKISEEIQIPSDLSNNYEVKAFIWNGTNLKPLNIVF